MACNQQLLSACLAIISLGTSLGAGAVSSAAELTLTKDGRPGAVIVLAEAASPAARKAAAVLRDHLQLISGAELKVTSEAGLQIDANNRLVPAGEPQQPHAFLLVGQSNLTKITVRAI